MNLYQELVDQCQYTYSKYHYVYAQGSTPYELAELPEQNMQEQVERLVEEIDKADCVIVGGASGLSAAGGGDFYYAATPSYRKYFGKFYDKYGFDGAFAGMYSQFPSRNEHWGYVATFLHTTLTAPARAPYLDLATLLQGKDFHVITTNQDTQFLRVFDKKQVSELQGDHRYLQCARCCTDDTWDSVKPVEQMIAAMGDGTSVPDELIPRCPHCGGEAFPWVRGYGNFLQGSRYNAEYQQASDYLLQKLKDKSKILFLELGVGRLTPMFIQEPFWQLTYSLKNSFYISVNTEHCFLPKFISDRGMVIKGDLGAVLHQAALLKGQQSAQSKMAV